MSEGYETVEKLLGDFLSATQPRIRTVWLLFFRIYSLS